MRKLIIICASVILPLFAMGCAKTIDLSDEQNYLVAEYAAELLIRHGTNIDLKYYYEPEEIIEETTEITTEEITSETTELTTEEITEVSTEEPTTQSNVVLGTGEEIEDVNGIVANQNKEYDIAKFIGESNLSIKYSYYMILDRYPSVDQDGIHIEIQAPKGYKLVVVKFNVENKTNDAGDVDLYSKDIEYKLIVNDKKATKQMLTILLDDLYTYKKTIEPSMFEETVLAFQVSDEIADSIKDLKLQVNYEGEQTVLQLK